MGITKTHAISHETKRRLSVVSIIEILVAADDKHTHLVYKGICDRIHAPNIVTFIRVRWVVKAVKIEV